MHKIGLHVSNYGCHSFNLGLKLQMPSGGEIQGKKDNFLYNFFFSLIFIFNFP